jgi:hypothetical protein
MDMRRNDTTIQYASKACVVYCVAEDGASYDVGNIPIVRDGSCGVCAYRQLDNPTSGLQGFFQGVRQVDPAGIMHLGTAPHVCLVKASSGDDTIRVCRESVKRVEVTDGGALDIAGRIHHALYAEDVAVVYLILRGTDMVDAIFEELDDTSSFSSNVFTCLVIERPGHGVHDLMHKEHAIAGSLRPPQSFMFLEGPSRENDIDHNMVGTFVYRLPGSTRVDPVDSLTHVEHVYRYGAHKCIAVERILHEVAYKIGYSFKYGA